MEYGYDAYGQIAWRGWDHTATPAPRNPVGHQGLFADRLDAYAGYEQLVPNARILYHNRNRTYDPRLGRFLQQDPNATGQPLAQLAHSRSDITGLATLQVDLQQHYADGMSTYAARRSSPLVHQDPSGLFIQLLAPTMGYDVYVDYNTEVISNGMQAKDSLNGMLQDYGYGQLDMIEMLMDWSIPDTTFGTMTAGGAVLGRIESHHIIPRFLWGIDDAPNRLDIPQKHHREYHSILNREFTDAGLPPVSRRNPSWRAAFQKPDGGVTIEQQRKIREALINAGRELDSKTGNKYGLAKRT